jgi:hypothetical protein
MEGPDIVTEGLESLRLGSLGHLAPYTPPQLPRNLDPSLFQGQTETIVISAWISKVRARSPLNHFRHGSTPDFQSYMWAD